MSFIGVSFTPADLYINPHRLFVQLAFTTFFVGVISYALAILINRSFPNLYALVNIIFGALLGFYIWLLFFGPSTNSVDGLMIQVTGQMIITYAAIISVFIQAYSSRSVAVVQFKEKKVKNLPNHVSIAS